MVEYFNVAKMIMVDKGYKSGSYFEIADDYVKENSIWWSDISENFLIITDKVPVIFISDTVVNCFVVMTEALTRSAFFVVHRNVEMIDKRLSLLLADALINVYG